MTAYLNVLTVQTPLADVLFVTDIKLMPNIPPGFPSLCCASLSCCQSSCQMNSLVRTPAGALGGSSSLLTLIARTQKKNSLLYLAFVTALSLYSYTNYYSDLHKSLTAYISKYVGCGTDVSFENNMLESEISPL